MPKILLVRFSSIGDIVLTSPVVRCLKKQLPDAEVHFLTKRSFSSVIEHNPYIDKKWFIEKEPSEILNELKAERFELIVDLHHNLRTKKLKLALGNRSVAFDKVNLQKWVLVNFKIDVLPKVHIVDRYMETVKSLGVKNDLLGLDYFITEKEESAVRAFLPPGKAFVAWVIGAKHFTKQLPAEKIIAFAKSISSPIVLLGGTEDVSMGKKIQSALSENVIDLCGKLSLNESAAVIKNAERVYTNDTGLMHIAAAFKKEIVSFWGNTVPEFGMYPYLPGMEEKSTIVENRELSCRPCSKIGFSKCPRGHFRCMNDLTFLAQRR